MTAYLGIDFGTSGARLVAIDTELHVLWRSNVSIEPGRWRETLFALIRSVPADIRVRVSSMAIDGTSSTVLLCDRSGAMVFEPLWYHDKRGEVMLEELGSIAPPGHITINATSSLAKLLWFTQQPGFEAGQYFLHQADWLAAQLHGKLGVSDYHNALKLGYDVQSLGYPDWLVNSPYSSLLPQVLTPGTPVGVILPAVARELGLANDCVVCAGTTDSIAAFMASRVETPGFAVTSLGSTLVVKLLSRIPVDDVSLGIYSHRFGDLWLVGGASNTGGAVLRAFFSDRELSELSQSINPQIPSQLDYYPLLTPGERFPINDPNLAPRLSPRPDRPIEFLHGLLEGIAKIETQGYQRLSQLGATPLTGVYTAGGGAKNLIWSQIRQRYLGVPVLLSQEQDAAYGTAVLAQAHTGSRKSRIGCE